MGTISYCYTITILYCLSLLKIHPTLISVFLNLDFGVKEFSARHFEFGDHFPIPSSRKLRTNADRHQLFRASDRRFHVSCVAGWVVA